MECLRAGRRFAYFSKARDNRGMPSVVWNRQALVCCLLLVGRASAAQLPDGPGKAVVQRICSGCHSAEIVLSHRGDTKEGWEIVVRNMVDKGANGTDDEFNTVIDYLAAHFPKKTDAKENDNEAPKVASTPALVSSSVH